MLRSPRPPVDLPLVAELPGSGPPAEVVKGLEGETIAEIILKNGSLWKVEIIWGFMGGAIG